MDGMGGWVDYLHATGFLGEHVLSIWTFLLSIVVTAIICLSERYLPGVLPQTFAFRRRSARRFLTVVLSKHIQPHWVRSHSRLATDMEKWAVWLRHVPEIIDSTYRLYMLIAMSYQLGAIASVVITLSIGQFFIEYLDYEESNSERYVAEPLLGAFAGRRQRATRSRTRSKPDSIFIHPNESNLARADAVALESGIAGDTEFVQGNGADGQSWQLGKGKGVTRDTMFGGSQHRVPSDTNFDIGHEDEE